MQCYLRHLTSKPSENEDFGTIGDLDRELVLEQVRGGPEGTMIGAPDLSGVNIMPVEDPSMLLPPQTPATPGLQKQRPGRKRKAHELDDPNQVRLKN